MITERPRRRRRADSLTGNLTRGLGWFSVGLGIAQILAPRAVCRLAGLPPAPTLTRMCGVRELACGIGILVQPRPAAWMQARVAGDAMDLACLALAAPFPGSNGARIAVSMGAVGAVTALDAYCARVLAQQVRASPVHVRAGITIERTPEELYRFWRNFENLPRVMPYLTSIRALDGGRLRWTAKGPGGIPLEWDAEIIDDKPNTVIAWRSVEESKIWNAGSISFDRAGNGTYVSIELLYYPPPGSVSAFFSRLFRRDSDEDVRADLTAFKQLMESGA